MILCDAGPLVALIDTADTHHVECTAILPRLSGPLITTWPCLTEAMHLLGRKFGFKQQRDLWHLIELEAIILHSPSVVESQRMRDLMDQYQNIPMDLADASLVAAAEVRGLTRIFTLDTDFRVYRILGSGLFEVVP